MPIFRRTPDAGRQRPGTLDELERLVRRVLVVPLVAPVLLVVGVGLGKATSRALALPAGTPLRIGAADGVPRVQLEALGRYMEGLRNDGERVADYVVLYREHVAPVERVLLRRGVPGETAREIAWPLVEHAARRGLDPATVLSVLLVESDARPQATSPVGARGLMQVMPLWAGRWQACNRLEGGKNGRDLYHIETNLCTGTSVLAWYLGRSGGDYRRALLGYNGCVRGTNTPDCRSYPDRVLRLRAQIERELQQSRAAATAAAAP